MTNYDLPTEARKVLLSLSLETDFDLECDALDEGHAGAYIPKIVERAEKPGYSLFMKGTQFVCRNEETGREYVLVAGSTHLVTDDFATESSTNATKMFDELLLLDEAGEFLEKKREDEVSEFVAGVRKETSRMYEESRKLEIEYENEERTEVG